MNMRVAADPAEFFDEHYEEVRRFLGAATGARASDVEDLVQETLLHAWRNRAQFRGDASPLTWIMSIARNRGRLYVRSRQRAGSAEKALRALGRFDDAIQSFETAAGIAPEVRQYTGELANVHATIGNIALGEGNLSAAQFRFETARDLDPLNSDLKFGLAAVFISQGKEKINQGLEIAARTLLGRATALLGSDKSFDKELAVSYLRLGHRALSDGMEGLAELNFEEAFKRNPNLGGLRRLLTDRYRENGQNILDAKSYSDMSTKDFETVVDNFQKAVDTDPTRSSFKSSLGNELNEFGLKLMNTNNDYERALEMFGRARALFPNNATYRSNYEAALELKIQNPTP